MPIYGISNFTTMRQKYPFSIGVENGFLVSCMGKMAIFASLNMEVSMHHTHNVKHVPLLVN